MPNRIIKESICTSDSIDQLSWFEEVLFYRLMVNCDDYGRYDGRPAIIKNRIFPLKNKLTEKAIKDGLSSLVNADLIIYYVVDGKPFLQLKTWEAHQNIRAKKSKYPSPSDSSCIHLQANEINCKQMTANVPVIQSNPIQSESESNPMRSSFTPPTLEEVTAYVKERGSSVDPIRFWSYYDEGNWTDAKGNKVRNWKQKLITWEKSEPAPAASRTKKSSLDDDLDRIRRWADEHK